MSKRVLFAVLLLTLSVIGHCAAAQPMIELTIGGKTQSFSQGALLARPDAAEIHVPRDVAYGTSTTYRAVPLADLLDSAALPADSVLEARATDGFAAQLPAGTATGIGTDGTRITLPDASQDGLQRLLGQLRDAGHPCAASSGLTRSRNLLRNHLHPRVGRCSPSIRRCRQPIRSARAEACSSLSVSPVIGSTTRAARTPAPTSTCR